MSEVHLRAEALKLRERLELCPVVNGNRLIGITEQLSATKEGEKLKAFLSEAGMAVAFIHIHSLKLSDALHLPEETPDELTKKILELQKYPSGDIENLISR